MRKLVIICGIAVVPMCGAATAVADDVRVAEWRFDEAAGQAVVDHGPHELDGHLGAADGADAADPARIAGASGGALRFESASFVRLPDSPVLAMQTLTAEAVVRAPSSPGAWRYLVSRGGQRCLAGAYGLYTGAAGGIALYVFDGSRYVVSPTARSTDVWDGEWHHVAGTFDGTTLRVYVDGRPVGEPLHAPLRIDYAGTSTNALIGQYAGECDLAYKGDVDLVRLWSGGRSPEAVADAAVAATGRAVSPDPLPAADAGTFIPSDRPPGGGPAAAEGQPARGCAVRVARRRVVMKRRTVLRARVVSPPRARRPLRLVARGAGRRKLLSSARVGASGRARLVVRPRRSGRLVIRVAGRSGCAPVRLKVRRAL